MLKNRKGFTLIELLVVVAIIGLLSTLAVVALNSAREKSRDAKRLADVKQIQTALEMYASDKSDYPASATTGLGGASALALTGNGFVASGGTPVYMGYIPIDPSGTSTTAACSATKTDVGCLYGYTKGGTGVYSLYFVLEKAVGNLNGGLVCASQNGMKNTTCP